MKPTGIELIRFVADHFGLSIPETIDLIKTPIHPRELRDEFAMHAMTMFNWFLVTQPDGTNKMDSTAAENCYKVADAMLEARK